MAMPMGDKDNVLTVVNIPDYMDEVFIDNAFRLSGVDVGRIRFCKGDTRGMRNCYVELKSISECHNVMQRLNDKIIPRSAPIPFEAIFHLPWPSFFLTIGQCIFLRRSSSHEYDDLSLFVTNLSDEVSSDQLYSFFVKRYPILSARVLSHTDGRSKNCAFVRFQKEYDLQKALVEMQHMTGIGRNPLRVRYAYKIPPKDGKATNKKQMNPYYPYQNYSNYWVPGAALSSQQHTLPTAFDYDAYCQYLYQFVPPNGSTYGVDASKNSDDEEVPIIEDDTEAVDNAYMEASEELYTALEESRWNSVYDMQD